VLPEEYWSYDDMVLQLDDCVMDHLKCLYPEFNYLFLFDHSCGYDRQREDGLNVENMPKVFSGKQSNLWHTLTNEERGYLWSFPKSQGCSTHDLPAIRSWTILAWWKWKGRKSKRWSDWGANDKMKLWKEELVKKLVEQGITVVGNLAQVQKLAKEQNMTIIEENFLPKVKEGWEGKPKGVLQVLWERSLSMHWIWSNTHWMEERMLMAFTNPTHVWNIFLGAARTLRTRNRCCNQWAGQWVCLWIK